MSRLTSEREAELRRMLKRSGVRPALGNICEDLLAELDAVRAENVQLRTSLEQLKSSWGVHRAATQGPRHDD